MRTVVVWDGVVEIEHMHLSHFHTISVDVIDSHVGGVIGRGYIGLSSPWLSNWEGCRGGTVKLLSPKP